VEVLLIGEIEALDAHVTIIVRGVDEVDAISERHPGDKPILVVHVCAKRTDAKGREHAAARLVTESFLE